MTRRKFTSKFKTKVVLEALKERSTMSDLAQNYKITPQQISTWKRDFINGAEGVFAGKTKSAKTEAEDDKNRLLKTIGQLKVENDF